MYLHLGQEVVVRRRDIIGVFDMDNTTVSPHTRGFLKQAEKKKQVTYVSMDLPKSFVVCAPPEGGFTVYLSQLNSATLLRRAENESFE